MVKTIVWLYVSVFICLGIGFLLDWFFWFVIIPIIVGFWWLEKHDHPRYRY